MGHPPPIQRCLHGGGLAALIRSRSTACLCSLSRHPIKHAFLSALSQVLTGLWHFFSAGCAALAVRVAGMSKGALEVVAAVTGAPSAQAFSEQMRTLTPDLLLALRHELRSMGLAQQHHAPDTSTHVMA